MLIGSWPEVQFIEGLAVAISDAPGAIIRLPSQVTSQTRHKNPLNARGRPCAKNEVLPSPPNRMRVPLAAHAPTGWSPEPFLAQIGMSHVHTIRRPDSHCSARRAHCPPDQPLPSLRPRHRS